MPRRTKTFDLEEEKRRLNEQLDELADKEAEDIRAEQAEGQTSTPQWDRQERREEAQRLEQMLVGVEWALDPDNEDEIDPIEEVTLGALNAAEYGLVSDYMAEQVDQFQGPTEDGRGEQMRRAIFATGAIIEAPFIDDDVRNSNISEKYREVAQLAPQFVYWLEQRGDELTTPEVEGNGFATRVEDKMTEETAPPSTPSPKHS
ncbi:hypothetical protein [Halorubrum tropicale]|uniref:Uncharacterized protein n=1 Tax=Halorubrum tropicale TaxID=1765655 RepID=A0A0M9AIH3_9EURY|nr:hypothetical protein [Halorubrum tropicale]KOX92699.1 hypothetical protein AMR74_16860 [Halorubrum tropicale]